MNRFCVSGVLALSVLLVNHASAVAGAGSFVTVEELKDVLKTKKFDRILETLNDVKTMRYQGEILPLVEDLWVGKGDRHPDLPLETVSSPIVMV